MGEITVTNQQQVLFAMLLEFAKTHSEPDLKEAFVDHAISDQDACREALEFWYALSHRRLLGLVAKQRTAKERDDTTKSMKASAVAKIVLMQVTLPTGKTLAESTGAECVAAGGWLARVGERVGPRGIVGEILSESQLRGLLVEPKDGAPGQGNLYEH